MKYFRIFFTFIGYCTTIAAVGGFTFWYIGYYKRQKATESTVTFRDISMTPVATEETVPPGQLVAPPQVTSPSTPRPRKTVRKPEAPVSVITIPSKPVTMSVPSKPVSVTVSAPEKTFVPVAKKTAKPKKKPATLYPVPTTSTLSFRVTDNGASPRTGRGIVDVTQTTELEQQVKRQIAIEQLQKAADQIRNPPVWESGIVKTFTGGN